MNHTLNHIYSNNMNLAHYEYTQGNYLYQPYTIMPLYYYSITDPNTMRTDNIFLNNPMTQYVNPPSQSTMVNIPSTINENNNPYINDTININHVQTHSYTNYKNLYCRLVEDYKILYNIHIENLRKQEDVVVDLLMTNVYYNTFLEKEEKNITTKEFTTCECQLCYEEKNIYYMTPCCGTLNMCTDCIKDYLKTKKSLCDCGEGNCKNKNYYMINCPFCKCNIKNFIPNINNLEIKK